MIKKEMSALLLLCILLVYNGKSSAMNKGEKNIPNKEVSVESDRLPIADPYESAADSACPSRFQFFKSSEEKQAKPSPAVVPPVP